MRTRIAGIVAAFAVGAAFAVVAAASSTADGLPSYTNGYAKWTRINAKPFTSTGPLSSAHRGVKNVYASRKKVGRLYPTGTVIVKTIQPSGRTGKPYQVAVMRKRNGRWRYDEYQLAGSRYRNLGYEQSLCQSCHAAARANDYVFTRK